MQDERVLNIPRSCLKTRPSLYIITNMSRTLTGKFNDSSQWYLEILKLAEYLAQEESFGLH